MHPDGYFALVLDEEARVLLTAHYATLPNPIAHHCTVRYGTQSTADLPTVFSSHDLGREFQLKVIGRLDRPDSGLEALVVALLLGDVQIMKNGFSENAIPHITVATDGSAEPVAVNDLLKEGYIEFDGPILKATLRHTRASSKAALAKT